jgi:hypothetical protein
MAPTAVDRLVALLDQGATLAALGLGVGAVVFVLGCVLMAEWTRMRERRVIRARLRKMVGTVLLVVGLGTWPTTAHAMSRHACRTLCDAAVLKLCGAYHEAPDLDPDDDGQGVAYYWTVDARCRRRVLHRCWTHGPAVCEVRA